MANVLITGANKGIGLELVTQYADAGDTVFAFARNPQKADKLNALAKQGRVKVHAMDVGDEKSITAAAKDVGNVPIDILINNAGILGGASQTLDKIDYSRVDRGVQGDDDRPVPGRAGLPAQSQGGEESEDHDGDQPAGRLDLADGRPLRLFERQGRREQGDAGPRA